MARQLAIGDIHGNYKALMQCFKRSKFNYHTDTLIVLGDVTDGYPDTPDVIEELLSVKKLILIMGNHDCLSEDTEVFTNNGWKKHYDIKGDDTVIGINENGLAEWQEINKVIVKKSCELNEFNSERISMSITDNHRILHKTIGGYKYNTIKDYDPNNSRYQVPLSAFSANNDVCIEDDELRLLAWLLTDGSVDKYNNITLYQSKLLMLNRIEKLLVSMGIRYKKYSRQRNTKNICGRKLKKQPLRSYSLVLDSVYSASFIKRFQVKKGYLPRWIYKCSFRQSRIFIEETLLGDGTSYRTKKCHILYGTKEFLSAIQALCSINGITANLTKDSRNTYRLNLNENKFATLRGSFKKIKGDFIVWCLNVKLSNFMVRRNGKTYFTGNCWLEDWLNFGTKQPIWIEQGGQATLDAYLEDAKNNDKPLMIKHRDFFKQARNCYIDKENRLFVHGGIPQDVMFTGIENVDSGDLLWDRSLAELVLYKKLKGKKFQGKEFDNIFLGHTQTHETSLEPIICEGVILLDQGAGWTGKLSIMDVDTKEFWQSDMANELYPNYQPRSKTSSLAKLFNISPYQNL